jgi:hypothetical protein
MPYRISIAYQAGSSGWSEQFFVPGAGTAAATASAINGTPNFWASQLQIRGLGVFLSVLRVNNVLGNRDTFIVPVDQAAGAQNRIAAGDGEYPTVGVLGQFICQSGQHRSGIIKGLADSAVERDANDQPVFNALIRAQIAAYAQGLFSIGAQCRFQNQPIATDRLRQIVSMGPSAQTPNATTITFANTVALIAGAPVVIKRLSRKNFPGYSGPLPTMNLTATTVDVPVVWRNAAPVVFFNGPYIMNPTYSYSSITRFASYDFRTRRIGRPFGLLVGRRPGQRFRQP